MADRSVRAPFASAPQKRPRTANATSLLILLASLLTTSCERNPAGTGSQRKQPVSPSSLYDASFSDDHHSVLAGIDHPPLDVLKQMFPCKKVFRVITVGGWGEWSVTTYVDLAPQFVSPYEENKNPSWLTYSHKQLVADSSVTIVHDKKLDKAETDRLMMADQFSKVMRLKTTDFESKWPYATDEPTYIIEQLDDTGYRLVLRQHGIHAEEEIEALFDFYRTAMKQQFHDEIEALDKATKNP